MVTIRHAEATGPGSGPAPGWRSSPALLCQGPEAILYSILDQVVDDYSPVVAGMGNDIDEIEKQLFRRRPHRLPADLPADGVR